MRCLVLAEELGTQGWDVWFLSRDEPGSLLRLAQERGFRVIPLPTESPDHSGKTKGPDLQLADARLTAHALRGRKVDWIVVDHYRLDSLWEREARGIAHSLLAIDDLGRPHDCDLLLDQNLHTSPARRYQGLLPEGCATLFGPSNCLLRREFYSLGSQAGIRRDPLRRVLVSFGATDPTGEVSKAVEALGQWPEGIFESQILGGQASMTPAAQHLIATRTDMHFHSWVGDMARLMCDSDLAIGAGGSASWERCATGLPALVIVVASNQLATMLALAETGAIDMLGESPEVTVSDIVEALSNLQADPSRLAEMSKRAFSIVESEKPGAQRVREIMEEKARDL